MKIRKIVAVMLTVSLVASSVRIPAFAEMSEHDKNTETETSALFSADYSSPSDAQKKQDGGEAEGKTSEGITLTATASDGVIVTMKAETSAFVSAHAASPSDAEEKSQKDEAASCSAAIRADEFDPALLALSVEVIEQKNEGAVNEALEKETKDDNIARRKTYDINVLYDGNKIEPLSGKRVEVSFLLPDAPSGADEVTVYHHKEDGVETIIDDKIDDVLEEQNTAETGEFKEEEEADAIVITGQTDSFSLYTIDFTYADKTINVPVGTTKEELSELLSCIGITDEITDAVACSDEGCTEPSDGNIVKNDETELFKVYQENDIWYIDSMNSFDTVHGLLVTTKNGQYKVKVTDTQATVYYSYPVYNDETIGAASGIKEWKTGETSNYEELTQKDPDTRWTWGDPAKETWIVVRGNFRYKYGIRIAGNVHLILVDGCKLYVSYVRFSYAGYHGRPGIEVTQDNSLTIYAGSMSMSVSGSGELKAVGNVNTNISTDCPVYGSGAGIGGGDSCDSKDGKNITINGGTITAIGGEDAAGIGGGKNGSGSNIIINGGTVYATSRIREDYSPPDVVGVSDFYNGVEGAGIGGGDEGSAKDIIINGGTVTAIPGSSGDAAGIGGGKKGDAENILINGGTVTTTIVTIRDTGGAGIGSGQDGIGSNITITGGTVSAIGGKKGGAGIGGGNGGSAHDITISGGTVNATGGEEGGAGIGGGKDGDGSSITISGGDVNATSGEEGGAGIGGGKDGSGSNIRADISEVVKAGDKKNPTNVIDHTDDTDLSKVPDFAGKRYVTTIFLPTVYYDANGGAGEMAEERAYDGKLSLPASGFTPPEGKEFIGWAVGSPEAEVSPTATTVNITGNTIIYALWGTNVCRRNFILAYVNYPSVQVAVKAAVGTDPAEIEMIRDSEENVIIENGKNITLDLNGFVLKGTGSGSVITNYGNLTIKDSNSAQQKNYFTVDDRGIWKFDPDRTGIGIYAFDAVGGLKKDGAPTTKIPTSLSTIAVSGGCITGGLTTNGSGGGICNENYLTIEGGIITGNSTEISADDHPYGGGGVYNGGSMSLEGGAVIGNVSYRTAGTASHYGGGIYSSAASIFYMDGGIVSCNKATDDGNRENGCGGGAALFGSGSINGGSVSSNAASGSGGGVYNSGSMQLNNAAISYNVAHDAGGMYNSSNVQMGGSAKIAENEADLEGGGVYNAGIFSMWGGSILSNTASSGGGVCNGTAAQFTMEHGSISGNTAKAIGGGVYSEGTFHLTGGNIQSNTAEHGGGVNSDGTFEMSGGNIVSNTAVKGGGGVYVNLQGLFNLSGGSISSNTAADSNGGGVSVFSQAGMQVGGSARVTGNTKGTGAGASANNVFLPTGRVISVSTSAALSGSASIGVTKSIPEGSSFVAITGTNSENYSSCFTSDSSYYVVNDFGNGNTVMLVTKTIELGAQKGSITEGVEGTVSYYVSAKPDTATVENPLNLTWIGTAPAGEVVSSYAGNNLTITVPGTVKAGKYSFGVKDKNGTVSNEATLIVGSGQIAVAYSYPEYKSSSGPSSGIKEWKTGTVGESTSTNYTVIDNGSALSELTAGWYVVTGSNVKINNTVTVTGKVHLILADGCSINVKAAAEPNTKAGIRVSGDSSLTVYAGSTSGAISGTGKLTATGAYYGSGIGGDYNESGSNIIINGGTVTAAGGASGAGIGGSGSGSGSNITINSGSVTATGGASGAGIGGGSGGSGDSITINGGEVTATGGTEGAGIGGAGSGSGSTITVNGGVVTATGGDSGAGIGGGSLGSGKNITISGGMVTATGGSGADGIGNGKGGSGSEYIYAADAVLVRAGDSTLLVDVVAHTSITDDIAGGLQGKRYVIAKSAPQVSDLTFQTSDCSYDGAGKPASFAGKDGMGTITVQYAAAKTLASAQWSDNVPKKANAADEKYYVKAVIAEGESYASAELICEDWKFTISPAKLAVMGTTVKDKIYDGTTAATVSRGQLIGKKGTDQVFIGSATGVFDSKDVGEGKEVTVSYTIIGADAGNYTAPLSSKFAATISQKTIYVEADDKQTRIGDDLAALTYTYEPALYEGDSFSGELSTNADKNTAGEYGILQNTLTAGSNYWISYTGGTYTVTTKEIQILSFAEKSVVKIYGDQAFTQEVTGAKTSVTYYSSNSAVAKVNASTGEVTIRKAGICKITADAEESETYAAGKVSYILTVQKAEVTVKADDQSKIYGEADPELTATVTGLIGDDTVTYTVTRAAGNGVGTYTITPSGDAVQGNYQVTYEAGTFTIFQAEISSMNFTVTAPVMNTAPATEVQAGKPIYAGSDISWNPSDALFDGGTEYTITFTAAPTDTKNYRLSDSVTVTVNGQKATFTKSAETVSYTFPATESKVVDSIVVKTAPAKTTYTYGELTDLTGLELTLTFSDKSTADRTYQGHESQISATPEMPTVATTALTISYGGKTTTQPVTVSRAELVKPVAAGTEFTYNGKLLGPVITGYDENTMWVRGNHKAVAAGNYRLTYALKDRSNYCWTDGTTADVIIDWSIAKAEGKITAPKAKHLTYNGSNQTLVTAGTSTTGTVKYSLNESGTYSAELPYAKAAGSYDVWYYAEGDRNHNDTARTKVTATITAEPEDSSTTTTAAKPIWVRDAKGWKFLLPNGKYAADAWYELDNPYASGSQEKKSWFRFGTDGYMLTGWFTDKDGKKYYLNPESDGTKGRMLHGKHKIDGKEYKFSEVHDGYFGHLIED